MIDTPLTFFFKKAAAKTEKQKRTRREKYQGVLKGRF